MASVQSTRSKKYELFTACGDEPTLHLASEGERLIHDLCVKQLDTNLTLEQHKKQEIRFERGSGFVPLSVHDAGSSTLQNVKDKMLKAERLEELTILGLTAEEANAFMNGDDLTFPESKVETSIKTARAKQIRNIAAKHRTELNEQTANRECIKRHERELLVVKPNSTETKLLQFALSCQSESTKDTRPVDHPINRLGELERTLFRNYDPIRLAQTVKRKRRQLLDASLPLSCMPKIMKKQEKGTLGSLWDRQTNLKGTKTAVKTYTCKQKSLYTIRDGEIIDISNQDKNKLLNTKKDTEGSCIKGQPFVITTSLEHIDDVDVARLPKFTVEEMSRMQRFRDYERGARSKVLYVKNLDKSIIEEDLVKLFSTFQRSSAPSIVYRLMSGKMRGQAFITFPDDYTAERALDSLNGCIIKGKPIVIQFGKT